MPYSLDLREKVISFINDGHGITETAKTFGISRATIYRWQKRPELAATEVKTRKRKIDIAALIEDVERDATTPLKERAKRFGVTPSALCYQFKKRKITRKKRQLLYQERDHEARIAYCQRLREQIKQYGTRSLVFIIKEIVEQAGHKVLFLLTYSLDLNDIGHDFSALKTLRMYAPAGTSIDEIIKLYCAS